MTISSGVVLTVNGGINANGKTVTVNGQGTLIINGATGSNGADGYDATDGEVGGNGFAGNIIVDGASVTVTGGTGGNGCYSFYGRNGGNGGIGVNGTVTVTGGSATLAGGIGGEAGSGNVQHGGENGQNGEKGEAVSRTITGLAEESDDNINWAAISGSTSTKQYVRITPAHTHSFTYSASGATITATCGNAGCDLTDSKAILTIAAPTLTTCGGTGSSAATLTGLDAFNAATNKTIAAADIKYVGRDGTTYAESATAPTDAGKYTAKITVEEKTASLNYEIAKADPIATAPTGLTAQYGQTLSDVTLTNPTGNTDGTWAWVSAGTTSVGNAGDNTFKANFTPTDTNYKTVDNVDVTITVGKAANPATVTGTATVIKGGNTVDLSDNVTMNGATGDVGYAFGGEAEGCTLSGSILTSGNTTGTVTVNVTVAADSNYEALAATPITVTINDKGTQTITAADVTASYGDTDKSVSASVTDPAQGGGAISYAVKDGSADYIDVNATTGSLTIKKVPADGKAYVVVTAAETAAYAQATKDVTITIAQVPVTPKVELNKTALSLTVNEESTLTATTVPEGQQVTWTSSDAAIAAVDTTGKVTAKAAGTAKVTATITVEGQEYKAECDITVTASAPTPVPSETIVVPEALSDDNLSPEIIERYGSVEQVTVRLEESMGVTPESRGNSSVFDAQVVVIVDGQARPATPADITPEGLEAVFSYPDGTNKDNFIFSGAHMIGETVKIETARWISFHKMVMEALADRPDVTLEVSFLDEGHKGTRKSFTIPAGTDTKSLVDDKGFAGFIFLTNKFGN